MTTKTLPNVTVEQIHILTYRLKNILQHKTRDHIKRMRLDIMLEDIELLYGQNAIKNHPVINQFYETIQEEREAVS
ncbi:MULTISPECIES: hypothetical protein [unclassified Sporosarcina]|uniref:hypothetical protein n=1 Tax=unclassified Sporosarcina TaxID=2647733 RepID=UPI00203FA942|nr:MULTISPECIES: hypothetical protein [unclassified Sporosarcina]GKV66732.1 hypothetical protein NCCP2331_28850 [Sporosarcina sp. NCCP-2331]GLB57085.1 hypothetical protein NCCP2378_28720 [Sporosarcina sp. NCCP-2378]